MMANNGLPPSGMKHGWLENTELNGRVHGTIIYTWGFFLANHV